MRCFVLVVPIAFKYVVIHVVFCHNGYGIVSD